MRVRVSFIVWGALGVLVIAVANSAYAQPAPQAAEAKIKPLGESKVEGTVRFEQVGQHVRVIGQLRGLSAGKHGFHIHQGTSCDAPGDHFMPKRAPHGSQTEPSSQRHMGDLGNLVADEKGTADYTSIDHVIALAGEDSVVGHALVVHAGEDDYLTQPSGDSGEKIGCGVITSVG